MSSSTPVALTPAAQTMLNGLSNNTAEFVIEQAATTSPYLAGELNTLAQQGGVFQLGSSSTGTFTQDKVITVDVSDILNGTSDGRWCTSTLKKRLMVRCVRQFYWARLMPNKHNADRRHHIPKMGF